MLVVLNGHGTKLQALTVNTLAIVVVAVVLVVVVVVGSRR